jgi:hypothetical protein
MRARTAVVSVVLVLASLAYGGGPNTITYQGCVVNSDGTPIADGTYSMRFSIYPASSGGAFPVWQEIDANVVVTNGLFSTILGDGSGFGTLFATNKDLWLEVAVDLNRSGIIDGNETYSPRQKMAGAAWAMEADTLDGKHASDLGTIKGVTAGTGLTGGGTSGNVALSADANYLQRRVTGTASVGWYIRAINSDGTVVTDMDRMGSGDITGVAAGIGLAGGGVSGNVTLSADTTYLQRRVSGSAAAGRYIRAINADGSVATSVDQVGTGDITSVEAGAGLTGGGTSGSVTLAADLTFLQRRVSGLAPVGQFIRAINADGTVVTAIDQGSTAAISAIIAGAGLLGGGTSGSVTLSADAGYLQRRVTGTAPVGQFITAISGDGSVLSTPETGDISDVTAGTGLLGGGASGNVTLSADTAYLQRRVTGTAPAGQFLTTINEDGTVASAVEIGDISGVTAGTGLLGGGAAGNVTLNADTTYLQRRVTGAAPAGQFVTAVNADGTVVSAADAGDISGVTAGTGLLGGGASGDVTLNADTTYLQRRVTGAAPAGQFLTVINADGTVASAGETGDISAVAAGTGLTGGGVTGNVTLNADTTYLQRRVTGAAPVGQFVTAINADGTVASAADTGDISGVTAGTGLSGGGASGDVSLAVVFGGTGSSTTVSRSDHDHSSTDWLLAGNSVTSGTHFLGTTNNAALDLRANGYRALRIEPNVNSPSLIGGHAANRMASSAVGVVIGGGGGGGGLANEVTGSYGTIGGGYNNRAANTAVVAGGYDNSAGGAWAAIAGGTSNDAGGMGSFVGGGFDNTSSGTESTVGGGFQNVAGQTGAIIGGGGNNQAGAQYSFIGGGRTNMASGDYAAVGGGQDNASTGPWCIVGGGSSNRAGNTYSTIGGGYSNVATELAATIGGGRYNIASSGDATIGGGTTNIASNGGATVAGGGGNVASGYSSVIGGGGPNTASGLRSTVAGGAYNTANGIGATVGGGGGYLGVPLPNNASGDYATIAGGRLNTASGHYSAIPGGTDNLSAGSYSFAAGRRAKANNPGSFAWADSTDADFNVSNDNRFGVRASGGVYLYTSSSLTAGAYLASGSGTWTDMSDRNMKENFVAVDGSEVLEKLEAIPISTWNYKAEKASIRHMGPTAQDLYGAFGLGDSDKGITTIDADGVALAAIQGLYKILQEKVAEIALLKAEKDAQIAAQQQRIAALEQRNHEQEARLAALERIVATMTQLKP